MSPRTIKSLAKFAAAATVLSTAALTAATLPASAAAYSVLYGAATNSLSQGSNQDIRCAPGNYGVEEDVLSGVIAVWNGCGTRLWLKGGAGWTYCVSPNHYVTLPGWAQFPTQAGVSTNKANC